MSLSFPLTLLPARPPATMTRLRFMSAVLLLLSLLPLSLCIPPEVYTQVSVQSGRVKGVNSTSYSGKAYTSFHAIPYAEPPLGDLRFTVREDGKQDERAKKALLLRR